MLFNYVYTYIHTSAFQSIHECATGTVCHPILCLTFQRRSFEMVVAGAGRSLFKCLLLVRV
jgi:hypothetical protein